LQSKGYTKFEEGDLLWAKITPCMQNGKSAIVKNLENGIGCGSTEFFVLRPRNNNVLIDYIYLLLRHHEVLKAAQSSFGGSAGQQRVSSQYLKSIIIPIPDYSIQKDIVAKIYNMKSQAKQLQKEGDKLLEEAKQKIEKLIFE
jgi:type I restriction enzyme S subunit